MGDYDDRRRGDRKRGRDDERERRSTKSDAPILNTFKVSTIIKTYLNKNVRCIQTMNQSSSCFIEPVTQNRDSDAVPAIVNERSNSSRQKHNHFFNFSNGWSSAKTI